MLGPMRLSAAEARVLGSLVEKAFTTPQQYPLTLASLVTACNQASNRHPVVDYDEHTVLAALGDLKTQRLVRFVLPSSGRTVVRYRQVLDEILALDRPQCALLAVLLLRGPQTVGELRLRTDRMTEFSGLDQVERELGLLASLEEPLAEHLSRRPGQKEERWACPLVDPASPEPEGGIAVGVGIGIGEEGSVDGPAEPTRSGDPMRRPTASGDDLEEIRIELTALRVQVDELRGELDALRASLGG
jgi:uncharacterized protein YceH (UPF0502 family)